MQRLCLLTLALGAMVLARSAEAHHAPGRPSSPGLVRQGAVRSLTQRRQAIRGFLEASTASQGPVTVDQAIPFEFNGARYRVAGELHLLTLSQVRSLAASLTLLPAAVVNPAGQPLLVLVENPRRNPSGMTYPSGSASIQVGLENFTRESLAGVAERAHALFGTDGRAIRRWQGHWPRRLLHEAAHYEAAVDRAFFNEFLALAYREKEVRWRQHPEVPALSEELDTLNFQIAFAEERGYQGLEKFTRRRSEIVSRLQRIYRDLGLPERYAGDTHAAPELFGYKHGDEEYFAMAREILFAEGEKRFLEQFSPAELAKLRERDATTLVRSGRDRRRPLGQRGAAVHP